MSLYLKYRPQKFADLSGQDHIKKTLQKGIELERLAHAYLFCGPRGTGKTTSARLIAKSLNCLNFDKEKIEPCNECKICKEINEGSLVDVVEIDAASNRGIDEIRELRESVKFSPYHAENKVYIIDEVHMLTKEAFNALLKTLEEPPANVYFVLATTEVHKIPDTIISRCQRYDFKRIMDVDILERISFINESEKFGIEEEALKLVVRKSRGGMRDAISLLDQVSASGLIEKEEVSKVLGVTPEDTLVELIELIIGGEPMRAVEAVVNINNSGYGAQQINLDMVTVLRDKLQEAVFGDNVAEQSRYLFLLDSWQKIWNVFKESAIPSLALEIFSVKTSNHFADINVEMPAPVNKVVDTEVRESTKTVEKVEKQDVVVEKAEVKKKDIKPNVNTEVTENEDIKNILENEEVTLKKREKEDTEDGKKTKKTRMSKKADLSSMSKDDLEKIWRDVVENIKVPVLKRTLQPTHLEVNEDGFLVKFNSNFHYKQVNKSENINLIGELLEEKLNGKVDFHFEVDTSLAEGLERKSQSKKVKHSAFDLDPSTGKPDEAMMEEESDDGLSVDEVAGFFS